MSDLDRRVDEIAGRVLGLPPEEPSGRDARSIAQRVVGEGNPLPPWIERSLRGEGVQNPDGSLSTIQSMSVGGGEGEPVRLIPTIREGADGVVRRVDAEEAVRIADRLGDGLVFPSIEEADRFSREFSEALGQRAEGQDRIDQIAGEVLGISPEMAGFTKDQLADTVARSARVDPERFARALAISRRLQVPVGFVDRSLERFEKVSGVLEGLEDDVLEARPIVRRFLSESETARRIAHDDIRNLSGLEWVWNAGKAGYMILGENLLELSRLYGRRRRGETLSMEESLRELELAWSLEDQYGAEGWFERGVVGASQMLPLYLRSFEQGLQRAPEFATYGAGIALAAGLAGPQAAVPEEVVTVPAAALVGVGVGFTLGMAEEVAELEANLAYGEYLGVVDENGQTLDREIARLAASAVGVANGIIEIGTLGLLGRAFTISAGQAWRAVTGRSFTSLGLRSGVGQLLRTSPVFRSRIARTGVAFGVAFVGEVAEEAAQRATTLGARQIQEAAQGLVGPGLGLDPSQITEEALEEALAAAPAVLFLGGGGIGVNVTLEAAGHGWRAVRANTAARRLDRAVEQALGSSLRERDRETFAEFAERVQEGDPTELQIPADRLVEYFQEEQLDLEEELAEVPEVLEQIPRALELGREVVIPLADYLAVLGPKHHAGLRRDVRVGRELSLREAERLTSRLDPLVEHLEAKEQEVVGELTSREKVHDAVLAEVQKLGFEGAGANGIAALWAARYAERARRTGGDPFELFVRENVEVIPAVPDVPDIRRPRPALEAVLADQRLKEVLRDLREGREPELRGLERTPILSLLRRLGGIAPTVRSLGEEVPSPAARALEGIGIERTGPGAIAGLFRQGGIVDLGELELAEEPLFEGAPREGTRVDPEFLVAAIQEELLGRPRRTAEETERIQLAEQERRETLEAIEAAGLELETATETSLVAALSFAARPGDITFEHANTLGLTAALRHPDGRIWTGKAHFEAFEEFVAEVGEASATLEEVNALEQGFVDDAGNFYSREEAADLARQATPDIDLGDADFGGFGFVDQLTSEDLANFDFDDRTMEALTNATRPFGLTPRDLEVVGDQARFRELVDRFGLPNTLPTEQSPEGLGDGPLLFVDDDAGGRPVAISHPRSTLYQAEDLVDDVPGLRAILPHLTHAEAERVTSRNVGTLVRIFEQLGKAAGASITASVAFAGRVKRGWYRDSAAAIIDVFGLEDAPRFAALLATLSPRNEVPRNAEVALRMWALWEDHGRTQDPEEIIPLLGEAIGGQRVEASVLEAYRKNAVRVFTTADPANLVLSGPKANSFVLNLRGNVNEVTNDGWMAVFFELNPGILNGAALVADTDIVGTVRSKNAAYIAVNAHVRHAARILSERTGEEWTPAEVQAAVWSWARTLLNLRESREETRSATEILREGGMTDDEIAQTDDFASLFVRGVYREIIDGLGDEQRAGVAAVERRQARGRGARARRSGLAQEAPGVAEATHQRHLASAARRIERIAQQRAANRSAAARAARRGRPPTGLVVSEQGIDFTVRETSEEEREAEADVTEAEAFGSRTGIVGRAALRQGIRPAIRTPDGRVIVGDAHGDAILTLAKREGVDVDDDEAFDRWFEERATDFEEGFLTEDGVFLTREETADLVREPEGPGRPVEGQLDLFIPEALPEGVEIPELPEPRRFASAPNVTTVKVGTFRSGVDQVEDHLDVAHIAAPLRKQAQESMLVVATDDDGNVLGILRHTTGTSTASLVMPSEAIQPVLELGATQFWTVHNHPSGQPSQSAEDRSVTRRISEATKDTGLEYQGMLVVTPGGKASFVGPSAVGAPRPQEQTFRIPARVRDREIGVFERRLRKAPRDRAPTPNPEAAISVLDEIVEGDERETGILLLNVRNEPVSFLPMTLNEMWRLRRLDTQQGVGRILKEAGGVNARSLIVFVEGNFGDAMATVVPNMQGFGEVVGLPVLDAIHIASQESARASGALQPPSATFFQEGPLPDPEPDAGFVEEAIAFFGLTDNVFEAGYILPDGRMLDLTGRHLGRPEEDARGRRQIDHGELGRLVALLRERGRGGGDIVADFMNTTGAIRVDFNQGLAEAQTNPTDAQVARIVEGARGLESRSNVEFRRVMGMEADDLFLTVFLEASTPSGSFIGSSRLARPNGRNVRRFFDDPQRAPSELFAPGGARGPRGSITFDPNLQQVVIRMFESQNLSTFLHESGHLFLEQLRQDALALRSPEDIRDWRVMAEWLEVPEGADLTPAQHDKLARAFEVYLREGRAPTIELRDAFARFRAWMMHVYRSIVDHRAPPLTPEVRAVMDRLFASEEAIEQARTSAEHAPMWNRATAAGMTQAEFEVYARSAERMRAQARSELDQKVLAELRRIESEEFQRERERIRAEVEREVNARPMYQLRAWLQTGRRLDGREIPGLEHAKLSRDGLVAMYGKGILRTLATGRHGFWQKSGGHHPDELAEVFGFPNGDQLVRALVASKNRKTVIDQETAARMAERFPDMRRDGSITEAALQAWENPDAIDMLLIEERVLAKRVGADPTARQALLDSARRIVREQRLRDLTPARAREDSLRAGRQALHAAARGDWAQAMEAKRRELLQLFVARESQKAVDESARILGRLREFGRRRIRERIGKAGGDYLAQLDEMLERFSLRPRALRAVDKLTTLAEWIREQEEAGEEVIIEPELRDEAFRVHFKNMTMEQLRALDDATKHIAHLAKKQLEFRLGAEREVRAAMAERMAEEADESIRREPSRKNRPVPRGTDRLLDLGLEFLASMEKLEFVANALAGRNPRSLWHTAVIEPLQAAQQRYNGLTEKYTQKLDKLVLDLREAVGNRRLSAEKEYSELRDEQGRPFLLDHWGLIAIALNMGNESNKAKLLGGYGWNESAVMAVLNRELSRSEWRFVQDVWDTVDELWPEILELEKRLSGVPPPRVEATALATSAGPLRGGYYPVVYDPRRSRLGDINLSKTVFGRQPDGYSRATTGHGHTKERTKVVRPILLDMKVLTDHMDQVILDLSFRETLMEVGKLLSERAVNDALRRNLGQEFTYQRYWLPALQAIAGDTRSPSLIGFWHKAARGFRKNATIFKLGFRETTLLVQAAGHFNAIDWMRNNVPRRALQHWGWGLRQAFGGLDPRVMARRWRQVQEESAFMRQRVRNVNRDLRDIVRDQAGTLGQRIGLRQARKVQSFAMELIARVQMLTVDYPVWLAAHRAGMEELDLDHAQAVQFADRAVRMSQGGGTSIDQSGIERGGKQGSEFLKTLNLFYSYQNVVFNQLRAQGRGIRVRDFPAFLATYLLVVSLPGLLSYSMYALLRGTFPPDEDDEEFEEQLVKDLARAIVLEGAQTVPVARELYPIVLGERPRSTSAASVFEREIKDLTHYKDPTDLMFDVLRTVSLTFGVPGDRVLRATEELIGPEEE